MKRFLVGLCLCCLLFGLYGCGTSEPKQKDKDISNMHTENNAVLIVTETTWGGEGKPLTHHYEYKNLKAGDGIYGGFAEVSVNSITPEKVVLNTVGLIEPNEDGTTNLSAKGPSTVTLKCSESIELVTQTMDAGAKLIIQYGF